MSSARRSLVPRLLVPLLPALVVACLAGACGRDPVALSFADYVRHQRDNLTSGLISAPGGVNTHLLSYGWQPPTADRPYAELVQNVGHIRLFAATGELRQLALRGAIDQPQGTRRYRLLLNGRRLRGITFGPEWQERRFDLPADSVRQGANLLALRCRGCPSSERHRGPRLRLRQLRLQPAPANLRQIRRPAPDGVAGRRFLMPTPAYLDVVAELPPRATFHGEVVAAAASAPATATLAVLDALGERVAGEWRLEGGRRSSLRADLSAWEGRLVRLRLAAGGPGNPELDWLEAVVTGLTDTSGGGRLPVVEPAAAPRSGRLGRPDVLVVLLDAARADAFAPFGGPYPSPALERLAQAGTRFTEAWAPASWTQPSVSALLSGWYPDSVGTEAWGSSLPADTPRLAELLSAAGYRTVLWHQHPFYRAQEDLQLGFGTVRWARTNQIDPVPPAELLFADGRPTFTLVHLLPPHAPYEPPAPFRGLFSSWYDGDLEVTARVLNQFHGRRDPRDLSPDDRRYIRDRYLENAAYADSLVGRISDLLADWGRFEDTLIVVLSDHGESFLEHGRFLHARQLHRESIHVPLVVKWPATVGAYRGAVEQPVSLVDLVPTLVDGLGLETSRRFQGRSLLPAALDGRAAERPVYAVTRGATASWRPPAPQAALRHGRLKALYEPLTDRLELYDVASDPGETRDLAADRALTALLLRQAVREQMALNAGLLRRAEPRDTEPLDPEIEQRLRDLGYLGQE